VKIPIWKRKLHHYLLLLEQGASRFRKRIIIDPRTDFFVSQPLKQANRFLNKLYTNDNFYNSTRYAWVGLEDAKKLFLYGCARQVLKASVVLLENEEHILGGPGNKAADTTGRIILESIIDTQNIIARRHIELLVNLINFSNFEKEETYRIYLSAENLDYHLGRQADFLTFYENRSGNIDFSIKKFSQRIEDDLETSGLKGVWFLQQNWKDRVARIRPSIFTSIRRKFMLALPHASDDERIMMGLSYQEFFSEFSVSAHFSAGSRTSDSQQNFKTIERNMMTISILGQHIMSRSNRLMGFDDEPQDIQKIMEGKSDSPKILQRWRKVFHQGDLILAMNDLSEICECRVSVYGYTACRVKFLTKPPLSEIPEDWLPAAFISMVLPKEQVRSLLLKNKDNPNISSDLRDTFGLMERETDDELMKLAKNTFIDLHKKGLLIPMLLDSGIIKRREDLD